MKGRWRYLYRAVDSLGRTVDFDLSPRRDVNAAKPFFRPARKRAGPPRVITLAAYPAPPRAVRALKVEGTLAQRVRVRASKSPNKRREPDHRRVKQRTRPRLGFKRFEQAAVTIRGLELVQKVYKEQFKTRERGGPSAWVSERWKAVLAA